MIQKHSGGRSCINRLQYPNLFDPSDAVKTNEKVSDFPRNLNTKEIELENTVVLMNTL